MRKLVSSINMKLDGFCDHTAGIADDDLHHNANEILRHCDSVLVGRITYPLMESGWPPIVKQPTRKKLTDDFAVLIDDIPKIVFSTSVAGVDWQNTTLVKENLTGEVLALKQKPGKDRLAGSSGRIVQLKAAGLIDEYQFCIHPVILGKGLPLFKSISE